MSRQGLARKLLRNPEAFTSSLVVLLLDHFGPEMLQWHPMTIRYEILDDFHVLPPKENLDKIYAGVGLLTSDDFYRRLPAFIQYCNILSGGEFNPAIVDIADADECAWGITEGVLLAPPEDEEEPFSEEIRYYIGGVLDRENIANPPDVLRLGKWDRPLRFSDISGEDADLFRLEYEAQTEKAREIEQMLKQRLRQLLDELASLPLEHGNTQSLLQSLRAG